MRGVSEKGLSEYNSTGWNNSRRGCAMEPGALNAAGAVHLYIFLLVYLSGNVCACTCVVWCVCVCVCV